MEKVRFSLLIILVATLRCTAAAGGANAPTTMDFISASCKTTLHPALCIRCLSSYAGSIQRNDRYLAKAAVTVSLNDAKSSAVFVSKLARVTPIKPKVHQAVRDCIGIMTNSVASLNRAVQELEQMGRTTGSEDFEWHMSNVETWVGSALTNQDICSRGFGDDSMNGHVKDAVTKRMAYASQVTSNALALVNRFAVRHRKGIH